MSSSPRRGGSGQSKQLEVIKNLVAAGAYHYSGKVHEFISEGWYEKEDLERCVLYATTIHKIEEDEMGVALDGCKYTILGRDTQGQRFYTCGKIILSPNDQRQYFFITAHDAT